MTNRDNGTIEGGALQERGAQVAAHILEKSRVHLMLILRFMDRALWHLPLVPAELNRPLATDNRSLQFDPDAVIDAYVQNPYQVTRTYLHSVLHCVFRHPLHTIRADVKLWSLACDICVEAIALELCDGRLALDVDGTVKQVLDAFVEQKVPLTPASIYRAMLIWREEPCPNALLAAFVANEDIARELFARDSHKTWRLVTIEPPTKPGSQGTSGDGDSAGDSENENESGQGDEGPEGDDGSAEQSKDGQEQQAGRQGPGAQDGAEGEDERSAEQPQGSGEAPDQDDETRDDEDVDGRGGPGDRRDGQQRDRNDTRGTGGDGNAADAQIAQPTDQPDDDYEEGEAAEVADPFESEIEAVWKSIASEMETALQTIDKRHGDKAGNTLGNLSLATRSRVDYEAFLHRFSTIAEDVKLNNEEFDYLFYTYGLDRYGNMPLIEPLEYCEDNRIRDFVIAIDTSESCSNGLTRIFLTRTYEILRKSVGESDRVSIHIVQCDAEVQSDTVITCLKDILAYADDLKVGGLGGTDFRPVFAYVDQLLEEGAFRNLRGMVYFTDGEGVYPDHAPSYDVAFVFVENEGKQRRVPPWACKVVMSEDDIEQLDWGW